MQNFPLGTAVGEKLWLRETECTVQIFRKRTQFRNKTIILTAMLCKADTNVSDKVPLSDLVIESLDVKRCFESWLFYVRSFLLYYVAKNEIFFFCVM